MFEFALFCFHFAGGAARSFEGLEAAVPRWLKVEALDLPGHGVRRGEAVLRDWGAVVADGLDQVRGRLGPQPAPYALFGHSMGAMVATEVAHAMTAAGHAPRWLGVAGSEYRAPRDHEPDWLTCPDARVVERMRELGGTPPDLLDNAELMQIVLPVMRADLSLCAAYAPPPRPKLPCAMLALGGTEDDVSQQQLHDWRAETCGAFETRFVAGGHFFVSQAPREVADIVSEAIARAAMGSR